MTAVALVLGLTAACFGVLAWRLWRAARSASAVRARYETLAAHLPDVTV